jgi:CDP-diacylglycerol--glycerol-3-phosphate 3-phosphatidyltransferase
MFPVLCNIGIAAHIIGDYQGLYKCRRNFIGTALGIREELDIQMTEFVFLSDKNRERYMRVIAPAGNLLARLDVHPNVLSLTGLILSVLAGLVYSTGSFFWGAWIVVLAGTCDALDGQLSRQTGKTSRFGAFFDSTLDRFGEVFIFMGLAWHFAGGASFLPGAAEKAPEFQSPLTVLFVIMAIAGSFMVSYTRARAEGLGINCTVGWMQRPERITLLIIGSLLGSFPVIGPVLMKLTVLLIAILSNFTAFQRIVHVRREFLRENPPGPLQ